LAVLITRDFGFLPVISILIPVISVWSAGWRTLPSQTQHGAQFLTNAWPLSGFAGGWGFRH